MRCEPEPMDDSVFEVSQGGRSSQVFHRKDQLSSHGDGLRGKSFDPTPNMGGRIGNQPLIKPSGLCQEMVWLLVSSTVADKSQNRAIVIVCLAAVQLFGYIVFLVWSNNDAFMMAVYYLASAYGGIPPLIGAWLNSSCGGDQQLRAISTALMISIG